MGYARGIRHERLRHSVKLYGLFSSRRTYMYMYIRSTERLEVCLDAGKVELTVLMKVLIRRRIT
jgi:hypothetical protein